MITTTPILLSHPNSNDQIRDVGACLTDAQNAIDLFQGVRIRFCDLLAVDALRDDSGASDSAASMDAMISDLRKIRDRASVAMLAMQAMASHRHTLAREYADRVNTWAAANHA